MTYYYIELNLPRYMTDADGGTIRLIMQHETDGYDQVRIVDEQLAQSTRCAGFVSGLSTGAPGRRRCG